MINYKKVAKENLAKIKKNNLYRDFPVLSASSKNPPYAKLKDDKEIIIWGNNNYLGITSHPEVMKAKIAAIEKFGTGSGGTRNVLGTSEAVNDLESEIADWYKKDSALVHISALDANIGVLGAIGKKFPDAIFLSDEKNHASMIDGIKMSGASKYIFKHNDLNDLEEKVKKLRYASDSRAIIIAVESVYSMDGDIFDIKELVKIRNKYNCFLYIDEVHAVGMFGDTGSGICEKLGLLDQVDIICGTLGKAVGSIGGYVVGDREIIDMLRHNSRNFIFTTSLPPDACVASKKSIEIIKSQEGKDLRKKHTSIVNDLKNELQKNNIDFLDYGTQIVPIILGSEYKAKIIAKELLNQFSMAATALFYPTVELNKARLRINPTPNHTHEMVLDFVKALKFLLDKYKDLKDAKHIANDDDVWNKSLENI